VAPHGQGWAVEFKTPGGEPSDEQVEWQQAVIKLGVPYLLTESFDEAISFVMGLVGRR
jgi:hypothetical protein